MSTRKYHHHKRRNWQPAFLAALCRTGIVNQAADAAGVNITTVFRARDTRNRQGASLAEAEQFGKDWDHALERAADRVENEIFRRAIDGVERNYDVYYKGEKVGTRTVLAYSDRLLMFLAKALRPTRYGPHWNAPDPTAWSPEKQQKLLEDTDRLAAKNWADAKPTLLRVLTEQYGALLTGESVEDRLVALGAWERDSPESEADSPNQEG